MNLKTGLMIAGGLLGAVGIGSLVLNKGGAAKDAPTTDPATTGVPPQTGGAVVPPMSDPAAGASGVQGQGALPGQGQAQGLEQATQGTGQVQAQQQMREVGPYTLIPDPQTGLEVVFETATQQPIGVLDANGSIQPIIVDAQGNATLAPGATLPQPGMDPTAGTITSSGMPGADTGTTGLPQAQTGASPYGPVADQLFAEAGAATSAAATGAGAVVAPTGAVPAGAQQVGEFTVVPDGSGAQLVLDTATQQPVGVIDPQGTLHEVTVDATGNLQLVQN